MKRTYCILNIHEKVGFDDNIVKKLKLNEGDSIIVFTKFDKNLENVITVKIPADITKRSAIKNFASKYIKEIMNQHGMLYVFEDQLVLDEEKFNKFLPSIEEMMAKLCFPIWFNTFGDPCNYVFEKYDPRVMIEIDDDKYSKIYKKIINICSHANTLLIAYDLDHVTLDEMIFDERFSIEMFFIIKFLADRRNAGKSLYNMYPSVKEEVGIFKVEDVENEKLTEADFKKEDELFRSLKVDIHPDNVIDLALDFIVKRLKQYADENGVEIK